MQKNFILILSPTKKDNQLKNVLCITDTNPCADLGSYQRGNKNTGNQNEVLIRYKYKTRRDRFKYEVVRNTADNDKLHDEATNTEKWFNYVQ